MLTKREARQRCSFHGVRLEPTGFAEWRVTLVEWPQWARTTEDKAYYTDDLEDAVLTGARMRSHESVQNTG